MYMSEHVNNISKSAGFYFWFGHFFSATRVQEYTEGVRKEIEAFSFARLRRRVSEAPAPVLSERF